MESFPKTIFFDFSFAKSTLILWFLPEDIANEIMHATADKYQIISGKKFVWHAIISLFSGEVHCVFFKPELLKSNNREVKKSTTILSNFMAFDRFPAMFSELFTFDLSIIGEIAMTTLIFWPRSV